MHTVLADSKDLYEAYLANAAEALRNKSFEKWGNQTFLLDPVMQLCNVHNVTESGGEKIFLNYPVSHLCTKFICRLSQNPLQRGL
jgi:hypothetical protein